MNTYVQSAHAGSVSEGDKVTLLYYDGLANQEQPITLTLTDLLHPKAHQDQNGLAQHNGSSALTPPLEHVLHTKWPRAKVQWSGSEPIL